MAKEYYYVIHDPRKNKYWDYYHEKWTSSHDQSVVVARDWGTYHLNTAMMPSNEAAMSEWFSYLEGMTIKRPRNVQIIRFEKKVGGDAIVSKTDLCADNFPAKISLGRIRKKYPYFDADELFSDLFHRFDAHEFKWIFAAKENFNAKSLPSDGAFDKRNTRIVGNTVAIKTDEQMAVARMLFRVVWAVDARDFLPRSAF